ncbi:MAG: PAN domain-containing protein, partial [Thermoanaerobaculia bacterium]
MSRRLRLSALLTLSWLAVPFTPAVTSSTPGSAPAPSPDRPELTISEPDPVRPQIAPSPAAQRLTKTLNYAPFPFWPTPVPVLSLTHQKHWENVAQVIAPDTNDACPTGQVVISTGSNYSNPMVFDVEYFHRRLYNSAGWFDETAVTQQASLPPDTAQQPTYDNVLVKLPDNSLVAFRLIRTWEPISPQPSWWNKVAAITASETIGCNQNGCRGGIGVWRSTDCGQTWSQLAVIDSAAFENGRYAWPRPDEHWHGGYDRVEAYADPWTGYIFVAAYAVGGPEMDYTTNTPLSERVERHFIFQSADGGRTWNQIHDFRFASPIVMTSTPDGRLYLFAVNRRNPTPDEPNLVRDQPTLFYTRVGPPGFEFSGPWDVSYRETPQSAPLLAGADSNYGDQVGFDTNSISRITAAGSTGKVRLSYQFMDGDGRTAIAVVKAEVRDDSAAPIVTPLARFHAEEPGTSILASSFIDPDPPSVLARPSNAALFYWIEGSTDPTSNSYSRFSIFRGEGGGTEPALLGGPWRPNVSIGHYGYGGAFSTPDGSLNFLAQWAESGGIRANIVSVPPYSPGAKVARGGGPFYNVDLLSADIDRIIMDTPPPGTLDVRMNQCAESCRKNQECVAWTYVRPNTIRGPEGNCYLKNAVPEKVENPCCISGTIGEANTDRVGGDYLGFDNIFGRDVTAQYCEAICYQQPKCKAWTFVKPNTTQGPKGLCYLKETVPPPVDSDCCVSGH